MIPALKFTCSKRVLLSTDVLHRASFLHVIAIVMLLGSCSGDENEGRLLPGERTSVLLSAPALRPHPELVNQKFELPAPQKNKMWTQPGSLETHAPGHMSLSGDPRIVWSRGLPGWVDSFIGSPPVLLPNAVFVVSGTGELFKLDSKTGAVIWSQDLKPSSESESAFGGGVSYANGKLYATTGLNEVRALDPLTGQLIWVRELLAPARGAPSVSEQAVLISSIDNSITALNPETGNLLWRDQKPLESTTVVGASVPAQNKSFAVYASAAGEVSVVDLLTGSVLWQDSLKKRRNFLFSNQLEDIHASPVISEGTVYVGSLAGRLLAFSLKDGRRLWEAGIATATMPWIAGDTLYVIENSGLLVALEAGTSHLRWVVQLPYEDENLAQNNYFTWTGPVLAGGHLWIGSVEGTLLKVSPKTGEVLKQQNLGDRIVAPLAVANDQLIIRTYTGKIVALQ